MNALVLKSKSIRSSAITSCASQIGFSPFTTKSDFCKVCCTKYEPGIASNHDSGPHPRNMPSLIDFCASSLLRDEQSFQTETRLNQVRLEKTRTKYLTFPIFHENPRKELIYVIVLIFEIKFKHILSLY